MVNTVSSVDNRCWILGVLWWTDNVNNFQTGDVLDRRVSHSSLLEDRKGAHSKRRCERRMKGQEDIVIAD